MRWAASANRWISSTSYETVPSRIFLDDALAFLSGDASLPISMRWAASASRWISSTSYGTVPLRIFLDDSLAFPLGDASLLRGKLIAYFNVVGD
ncbi:hypothetical protein RHMOL_Rhmol08G0135000 [Rhododendron molle]|uniref:Uncharacterized protein n=1 Tax=Rhododendron molle TaxID=49168 RepID=A0ACC0MPF3_RHOML|nr:hypothetical protein RHMOL_Rhmol08G0135000 [Rhododendron molle]